MQFTLCNYYWYIRKFFLILCLSHSVLFSKSKKVLIRKQTLNNLFWDSSIFNKLILFKLNCKIILKLSYKIIKCYLIISFFFLSCRRFRLWLFFRFFTSRSLISIRVIVIRNLFYFISTKISKYHKKCRSNFVAISVRESKRLHHFTCNF